MSAFLCRCPYCQERERRLSSVLAVAGSVGLVAGLLLVVVVVFA